jgi:2-oxoglutarate dehydrogenase E2 component (dihydrolipoamide succinyltransferase)
MATVEMLMPKMGESVMEGTVLSWLKNVGDTIEEDESLLEVATDKVDTEIPSTHAGILKEILAQEGDVIEVGKPIAVIETEGDEESSPSNGTSEATPEPEASGEAVSEATKILETAIAEHSAENIPTKSDSGRFFSPLVKSIAKEENISLTELENLAGTGKDGRITKTDILDYVEKKKSGSVTPPEVKKAEPVSNGIARKEVKPEPVSISGEDEIIEMDRMRKMIAERMVASKAISPHVTSFVEADVTTMVKWRNKMKNIFMERDGQKLTFTPIIIEAIVKAIKDYPMINIQVDGDKIIKKSSINIGLAVALPSGNLIVPVIQNADQYNLLGLTQKVNDLAKRARDNKLY